MKSKIIQITSIFIIILPFLSGCAQDPPKCSDVETLSLVKQIITNQLRIKNLSEQEVKNNLGFEFSRASAFDKSIKKYSCQTKLIAGKYELPITYESQLDDQNQHFVLVNNIAESDIYNIKEEIKEKIKESSNKYALSSSIKVKNESTCLKYEPNIVKISGKLVELTFAGPPNYESIENGDDAETGYYLELSRSICTVAEEDSDGFENIKLVQLVLDKSGYSSLRNKLNTSISIKGNLFAGDNGHHHASVLLINITQ